MSNKKQQKNYYRLPLFIFILGLGAQQAYTTETSILPRYGVMIPDSVDVQIVGDKRYVIHKLKAKETYYQLSRTYNVPVKDIINANNNKALKIGDTVRIPRPNDYAGSTAINNKELSTGLPAVATIQSDITEYIVGKNETLYAISRRFQITVETIKKFNNLESETLREGQHLKIPATDLPEERKEEPKEEIPILVEQQQAIDLSDFKPNRYGIREKREKGVAVWMDMPNQGQTSFALHKTAPIGTILKITNPMNKNVSYAKVVGKFGDNEDTNGAIVVLARSVATTIGVLDKRFQVELTYGVPLD